MRASVIDQTHPSNSIPSPSASISQQPFISENSIRVTRSSISNDWMDSFRKGSGGRIILFSSGNNSQKNRKRSHEDSILVFDGITSLSGFLRPCGGTDKNKQKGIKMRRWKNLHVTLKKEHGMSSNQFPRIAILSSPAQGRDTITARCNRHLSAMTLTSMPSAGSMPVRLLVPYPAIRREDRYDT
ncbi:hypothetical protein [Methanocalculus chunghsingensis]|uniref:hypothetical protein n=1 Tax=Methanocalculus chunghsingensis TaxID=156457 RepID=UPI001B8BB700|nr:hypothetical protein [Methanocalculus chunghsingensis]